MNAARHGAEFLSDIGWETEQFQRHRPHLKAVAYRMLGSASESEDALQEAWLRLSRSRQQTIHNARAWLTTVVGRVCIDMLRARQSRREDYVGAWVPEPIVDVDEQADPEQQVLMADTVGPALLVVLETLTPTERVAYVLHDMFELQQQRTGRADVARTFATFGPRFATRCHPATVNGQAGLVIQTPQGPLGAVGFTVSGSLITTIDLTLDPDKLEGLESLLSQLRGRPGSVAERIIGEALSWPGVRRAKGQFGSFVLRVGRRELGHLHGDAVADVPLPAKLQDQLVEDGAALERHDSGWVTVTLDTEKGVQQALALLRGNYEAAWPTRERGGSSSVWTGP
jgi:RNA polymerase sigma factor (sigma-70 family)